MNFRYIKTVFSILILSTIAANATAAGCTPESLTPHGDTLALAGVGTIMLGEANDPSRPTAWQGPLSLGACSLDIGIIEAPFFRARSGALYITSYSGAMRQVLLVDVRACQIRWRSKPFVGAVQAGAAGLKLGQQRIKLDATCVPVAGRRPVPG